MIIETRTEADRLHVEFSGAREFDGDTVERILLPIVQEYRPRGLNAETAQFLTVKIDGVTFVDMPRLEWLAVRGQRLAREIESAAACQAMEHRWNGGAK